MSNPTPNNPLPSHPIFHPKTWIFFDLDDTLHSYRPAASHATTCVLNAIIAQHPHLNLPDLQESYKSILASSSDPYFLKGRTSHEYRAERFTALLGMYGLDGDGDGGGDVEGLLDVYEREISEKLELKPHASELLRALKGEGKKVAVVSEGPHDAQERAISTLGIGEYVDYVETSNRAGIIKSEGLFGKVARDLGVRGGGSTGCGG